MQQSLLTAIKSFFIFGVPILISIFAAYELGYFQVTLSNSSSMATKPSNHNLNGTSLIVPATSLIYLNSIYSSPIPIKPDHPPFPPIVFHTDQANHPIPVFRKPLALFSQSPMTGFYRDGYCRTGPEDGGVSLSPILLPSTFPPKKPCIKPTVSLSLSSLNPIYSHNSKTHS